MVGEDLMNIIIWLGSWDPTGGEAGIAILPWSTFFVLGGGCVAVFVKC